MPIVKINFPGGEKEGEEINVEETVDRWSDIKLSDHTTLKIKQTIIKVIKIIDHREANGDIVYANNPDGTLMYAVVSNPIVIQG
jgi:hypothetical protein